MPDNTIGSLRRARQAAALVVALAAGLVLASCAAKAEARAPEPDKVLAHSSGYLGPGDQVLVVLADEAGAPGETLPDGVFSFEPRLPGRALREEGGRIGFQPARGLEPGKEYRVRFDRGLSLGGAPGLDYFDFRFAVRRQRYELELEPPLVLQDGSVQLTGLVSLGDPGEAEAVEKSLRVELKGGARTAAGATAPRIDWSHSSARSHRFTISNLARAEKAGRLELSWNGTALGAIAKGSKSLEIPAAGDFRALEIKAVRDGAPRVEIAFSERLKRGQDFRGLVSVSGLSSGTEAAGGDLRFEASGSILKVYASAGFPEESKVEVAPGILSESDKVLAQARTSTVAFGTELPSVRFPTKGVILPTSQGTLLPIETMNLSGVVVEAFRVHGDNMLQFLQVNGLDGRRELRRVGEAVWRKTLDLGWEDSRRDRWQRVGLDLSPLVAADPTGMYQIRVTFTRDQVRYQCCRDHDFSELDFPEPQFADSGDEEASFWDYWDSESFDYEDLERYYLDPCHPAFYLPFSDHDIALRRNVLVSDIGMIAQREAGGAWRFALSDLRTARPIPGAAVELRNFQRRLLSEGRTGPDGLLTLKPEGEAFVAVARVGKQASYLKVEPGQALAVSHFDIGGERADTGVKGLLFGERGVWRPGDDIYLTFILFDREKRLPAEHPIEFELENPQGQVVATPSPGKPVGGFYPIKASTAPDAPTGTWTARVKVGDATFSKALKIETVMPNRLKIELDLGSPAWIGAEERRANLRAAWLTGKEAPGLRAELSATLRPSKTSFASFGDYVFDDLTRSVSGERLRLWEGELDGTGQARFGLSASPEGEAPGMLKADLLTRVFEPSGAFSVEQTSVDFRPYERYVGIKLPKGDQARDMLLTDTEHEVQVALLDGDGKPISRGNVRMELYKLSWRWWWEEGAEGAEYASDDSRSLVASGTARVSAGKSTWKFSVKYPDWGRFMVRAVDELGHASSRIVYIDWPGWAGRARGESGGAAVALALTAERPQYAVGEKVGISFPSNEGGSALVTVERAGKVLRQEWVRGAKETTRYEFPADASMAPNVYVHVSFLQPHLQTANDLPIRLYGVLPVKVEDPATRLEPRLGLPSELKPGTVAEFTVAEARGKAMTYTVAVVDEGLLGLTKHRAPDPREEFYKKEASALTAFDLYQQVAGAFPGKLETLLAVGGGDDGLEGGGRKANRFKPVVAYFPPARLEAGQTARLKLPLGTYVGALRFMVVAGEGPAFGRAETEVPVRSDLMVLQSLPRVLAPSEQVAVPVTVFSSLAPGAKVSLSIKSDPAFVVEGEAKKTLTFGAESDKTEFFRVIMGGKTGVARFTVVAESGSARAEETIEVEIRGLGTKVTSTESATVAPGASWAKSFAFPGLPGTNGGALELSRLPSLSLEDRLGYLIGYPHGCAEQTTSKAFPQLFLADLAPLTEAETQAARANVAAAIEKLRGFQTSRGGFTLWPATGEEEGWLSAYVTHFLVEAERKGFALPEDMKEAALRGLARQAAAPLPNEGWRKEEQAYRLYVLAAAGESDLAAMNRLGVARPLPPAAQYRLAAAYALAGQREAARSLLRIAGSSKDAPGDYAWTYGSPTRDLAVMLEALNAMGETEGAYRLYEELAKALSSNRALSTQETAWALVAALPYAAAQKASGPLSLRVRVGAGTERTVTVDKGVLKLPLEPGTDTATALSVANASGVPVFARIVGTGRAAPGSERRQSSGLAIGVDYYDAEGNPAKPDELALGSDLRVEVTVSNLSGRDLRNLALDHRVPAGWEIRNTRLASGEEGEEFGESEFDYRDVRDDSVKTYFSLGRGQSKTFYLEATKAYEGTFFLPAIQAEAMYDPSLRALEPGRWLAPDFRPPRPTR